MEDDEVGGFDIKVDEGCCCSLSGNAEVVVDEDDDDDNVWSICLLFGGRLTGISSVLFKR